MQPRVHLELRRDVEYWVRTKLQPREYPKILKTYKMGMSLKKYKMYK